jgi:hypothetical protein
MALARIISRSQQCSRELAWELVARGYAVEIVSPDAVPDNLVDLELRVEADAAHQSAATVEARVGGHPASLAFVHRLKAPMDDSVRRPPETSEKVCFPAQPINFNAEPDFAEDVELPSENWRALEPARKVEILPDPEESAHRIRLPERLQPLAKELTERVRRSVTIMFHRSNRLQKNSIASFHRFNRLQKNSIASQVSGRAARQVLGRARLQSCRNCCRIIIGFSRRGLLWAVDLVRPQLAKPRQTGIPSSGGWFGRVAMTFAAVVLVAIVLGRGTSRGGAASVNQDSPTGPGKTAAAPYGNLLTNPEPAYAVPAVIVPTPASKSGASPPSISNQPVTPSIAPKFEKSLTVRPPRSGDDLVADDTVIYLDRPTKAAPARDSSRRRASSRKQSAGVASAGASPI